MLVMDLASLKLEGSIPPSLGNLNNMVYSIYFIYLFLFRNSMLLEIRIVAFRFPPSLTNDNRSCLLLMILDWMEHFRHHWEAWSPSASCSLAECRWSSRPCPWNMLNLELARSVSTEIHCTERFPRNIATWFPSSSWIFLRICTWIYSFIRKFLILCRLTGTIPDCITQLSALLTLDLSLNNFTGTVCYYWIIFVY